MHTNPNSEYNPIPIPPNLNNEKKPVAPKIPDFLKIVEDESADANNTPKTEYNKKLFREVLKNENFNKLFNWTRNKGFSREANISDIQTAIFELFNYLEKITGSSDIENIDTKKYPELSVILDTYKMAITKLKSFNTDSDKMEKDLAHSLYAIGDQLQKWANNQANSGLNSNTEIEAALNELKEAIEFRTKTKLEQINQETLQKMNPDLAQAIDFSLHLYNKAKVKLDQVLKKMVTPDLPPPIPQPRSIPGEPIYLEPLTKEELHEKPNIDSIINSLITFGKNNENQISDDNLLDLMSLPKEKVKQIMEEAMNEFRNQQKNLPSESRFKKVLSFFRGKNENQVREDQFLNGFAKLQTTIFKASPEILSKTVARGAANKERVGQIEDNLTSNAGYNIEKENIK